MTLRREGALSLLYGTHVACRTSDFLVASNSRCHAFLRYRTRSDDTLWGSLSAFLNVVLSLYILLLLVLKIVLRESN